MDTALDSMTDGTPQAETPQPIFNCPECSLYLPPGTLACPECHAITYSEHLRGIALTATAQENAEEWIAAREVWRTALNWLPPETKQYAAIQQRIGLIDTRLRAADDKKAKWTKRLGPLAPVVYFLAKAKTFFFFLLKAKFLLSFMGFFALYWALLGWKFALGFTVGILIHEMGHYFAARSRGLKVDLPVFLPGLGAYVRWYSMGISLDDLAGIALAGPFFGLMVAIVCAVIAKATGETADKPWLWSALAHVSAWLNIVNLVPILGLDGAQATYALDRTQRWLVLATTLIFFGMLQEWPFLLVALGMGWRIFQGGSAEKPSTKTLVQYMLILFFLGVVMYLFPDPMRRRF